LVGRCERATEFFCDAGDAGDEFVVAREAAARIVDVVLEPDAHVAAHRDGDGREW
jgi:hypothetical protein